jgi:predicted DsbA family dithiol-disulfide isomerase
MLSATGWLAPDFDAVLRLRPYQLDPSIPEGGVDRSERLRRRFPDESYLGEIRRQIAEAAEAAGAPFDPSLPTRIMPTLKSHLLVALAQEGEMQIGAAFAPFKAYWIDDADRESDDQLVKIVKSLGLISECVASRIADAHMLSSVREESDALRRADVTGVPTCMVNERIGFAGAMPPIQLAETARRPEMQGRA